jgi:choline kinase
LIEKYNFSENEIFYINKEWLEYDEIKDYKDLNKYFENWKQKNKI